MWRCGLCGEPFEENQILSHVKYLHVGCDAATWDCGQCAFTAAAFDHIAAHCLAAGHDPIRVHRDHAGHPTKLLECLAKIQASLDKPPGSLAPEMSRGIASEQPATKPQPPPRAPVLAHQAAIVEQPPAKHLKRSEQTSSAASSASELDQSFETLFNESLMVPEASGKAPTTKPRRPRKILKTDVKEELMPAASVSPAPHSLPESSRRAALGIQSHQSPGGVSQASQSPSEPSPQDNEVLAATPRKAAEAAAEEEERAEESEVESEEESSEEEELRMTQGQPPRDDQVAQEEEEEESSEEELNEESEPETVDGEAEEGGDEAVDGEAEEESEVFDQGEREEEEAPKSSDVKPFTKRRKRRLPSADIGPMEGRQIECSECGARFVAYVVANERSKSLSFFALASHVMGSHVPRDVQPYRCTACPLMTRTRAKARKHLTEAHSDDPAAQVLTESESIGLVWSVISRLFGRLLLDNFGEDYVANKRAAFLQHGA